MQNAPDVEFIETEPKMTGEDFGYLLSKFPGTMFWLGVNDVHALHSNKLVPDQTAILKGGQCNNWIFMCPYETKRKKWMLNVNKITDHNRDRDTIYS